MAGYQPQLAGLLNSLVPSVMKMGGYAPPKPPVPRSVAPVKPLTPKQRALIQWQQAHNATASGNTQRVSLVGKKNPLERVAQAVYKYSGAKDMVMQSKYSASHPIGALQGHDPQTGKARSGNTMYGIFPGGGRQWAYGMKSELPREQLVKGLAIEGKTEHIVRDLPDFPGHAHAKPGVMYKVKTAHLADAGEQDVTRVGNSAYRHTVLLDAEKGYGIVSDSRGTHHHQTAEAGGVYDRFRNGDMHQGNLYLPTRAQRKAGKIAHGTMDFHITPDDMLHPDAHQAVANLIRDTRSNTTVWSHLNPEGKVAVGGSKRALVQRENRLHPPKPVPKNPFEHILGATSPRSGRTVRQILNEGVANKPLRDRRGQPRTTDWADFDANHWNKR